MIGGRIAGDRGWGRWIGRAVARQLAVLALALACLAGLGARAEAQQCPEIATEAESTRSMTFAYPFNGTITDPSGQTCRLTCEYCIGNVSGSQDFTPRKLIRYTITSTLTDAAFAASLFPNVTSPPATTSTPGSGSVVWFDNGRNQNGAPRGNYSQGGNCTGFDPDNCNGTVFRLALGSLSMTATGPNPSGSVTISWSFAEEENTAAFTLTKQTTSGDGTFRFTGQQAGRVTHPTTGSVDPLLSTTIATTGGSGTGSFMPYAVFNDYAPGSNGIVRDHMRLVAGTYSLIEEETPGFVITGITCTGADSYSFNPTTRLLTVTVSALAAVACTSVSRPDTSTIVVTSTASGGDATFGYTSTLTGSTAFDITTTGGTGTRTLSNVTNGTYTITESAIAGWSLTNLTCTGGTTSVNLATRTATITIAAAGTQVACTYTNVRNGSLTIHAAATGGDATFPFTTSNTAVFPDFSLTTSGGSASRSFADAVPGTYTFTAGAVTEWALASIACTGATATTNLTAGTATVTVAAGGTGAACTFTQRKLTGNITLVANTSGGNGTVAFASTVSELNTSLTTSAGSAQKVVSKVAGTYTITQTSVTGGHFKSVACSGGTTAVDQAAAKATITLAANDAVTCTFTSLAAEEVVRQTQRAIARFTGQRASRLAANNAGGNRGMARLGGGAGGGGAPGGAGFALGPVTVDGQMGETGSGRFAFATSLSQIMRQGHARPEQQVPAHAAPRRSDTAPGERIGSLGGGHRDAQLPEGAPEEGFGPRGAQPIALPGHDAPDRFSPRRAFETVMRNAMAFSGGAARPGVDEAPPRFDIWLEGEVTRYRDGPSYQRRNGDIAVVSAGADYVLNPALLVGIMGQMDWATDTEDQGASVKGLGWMAGPYVDLRLTPNLFAHGRALWGRSSNEINPLGAYTDTFETTRAMYRAGLTGNWSFDAWRLTPSLSVAHFTEQSQAYVDTPGNAIAGTALSLSRLTFGPDVGYRIEAAPGFTIEPSAAVYGVWDFSRTGTGAIDGEAAPSEPNMHLRLQSGIGIMTPGGMTVRATGQYDGLGDGNFRAWGGQLQLRLPLQ